MGCKGGLVRDDARGRKLSMKRLGGKRSKQNNALQPPGVEPSARTPPTSLPSVEEPPSLHSLREITAQIATLWLVH